MKKGLIAVIMVAAVVFTGSQAFAWGHGKGMGGNYLCFADCSSSWQDLSETQKEKLKTLHQAFIDDTLETRMQLMQKRQAFRMLMQTSKPDKVRLLKLSEEKCNLQKEIHEKRINMMLEVKEAVPDFRFGFFAGHGFNGGMTGKFKSGQGRKFKNPGCRNFQGQDYNRFN
ncbi:MAG: periplasmic heavy metal sensor [Thermodesulfobacteriota bacterium]|nr:periplasmic heavy metal sensor [Thermodesulfobacteriota bacterium]